MSKRYYLSDLVNDPEDGIKPVIDDLLTEPGESASYAVSNDLGQALAAVETKNHTKFILAVGVDPLPDVSLDVKLNAIRSDTIATLEAAVADRNLNKSWANSDSVRELLTSVGTQIDSNFDVNNFGP